MSATTSASQPSTHANSCPFATLPPELREEIVLSACDSFWDPASWKEDASAAEDMTAQHMAHTCPCLASSVREMQRIGKIPIKMSEVHSLLSIPGRSEASDKHFGVSMAMRRTQFVKMYDELKYAASQSQRAAMNRIVFCGSATDLDSFPQSMGQKKRIHCLRKTNQILLKKALELGTESDNLPYIPEAMFLPHHQCMMSSEAKNYFSQAEGYATTDHMSASTVLPNLLQYLSRCGLERFYVYASRDHVPDLLDGKGSHIPLTFDMTVSGDTPNMIVPFAPKVWPKSKTLRYEEWLSNKGSLSVIVRTSPLVKSGWHPLISRLAKVRASYNGLTETERSRIAARSAPALSAQSEMFSISSTTAKSVRIPDSNQEEIPETIIEGLAPFNLDIHPVTQGSSPGTRRLLSLEERARLMDTLRNQIVTELTTDECLLADRRIPAAFVLTLPPYGMIIKARVAGVDPTIHFVPDQEMDTKEWSMEDQSGCHAYPEHARAKKGDKGDV